MARSQSLGKLEELVLLTVAEQQDQAYGVFIQDHLHALLDRKVHISAIHVALKRMLEKGFVRSRFGGVTHARGGRRKKFYSITALGKQVLDQRFSPGSRPYPSIPKISFT